MGTRHLFGERAEAFEVSSPLLEALFDQLRFLVMSYSEDEVRTWHDEPIILSISIERAYEGDEFEKYIANVVFSGETLRYAEC